MEDLAFVAAHADGVEFSFVQHPDDVLALQRELARLRPDDWHELALILKIETARAVHRLPDIIVALAYIGLVGFALDRLVSAVGGLVARGARTN